MKDFLEHLLLCPEAAEGGYRGHFGGRYGAGKTTLVKLLCGLYQPDGCIAENGSHQELMQLENGIYRNMFETQAGYYRKQ